MVYLSVLATACFYSCDESDLINESGEQHSVVLNFFHTRAALNKNENLKIAESVRRKRS